MNRSAELSPSAEADLAAAYRYYEEQVPGLGEELVLTVGDQLIRLAENPEAFPVVRRQVRRALVKRFPYALFYVIESAGIVVLAMEHQSRDPDRWKSRFQ